ncbi:hypothetical protein AWB74_07426 [Caballeronia arvi]|uniref:Uncharacterized protein n=1 Tax=Caballeronia arvi TaxID=1777135 RepID=A0A158KYE3_9BURK|nr:hypothetical protein [Caballeronia arvi]SAL85759.1 hypothetical protein AWB74_07426 [Caballeronia arvi]
MAQEFFGDDDDFESLPDPEVARIVLELDRSITLNRRAAALRYIVQGNPVPLPVKPSRAELLVLTALVQTYGPLLFGDDFAPVRQRLVECGAVILVQQVVLADPALMGAEGSEDGQIAACLLDARPMFETLCRKFPGAFLSDARSLLKRFTTPPAPPLESEDGEHDDG